MDDLTLSFNEINGELIGVAEYSADVFELATIRGAVRDFTNLLNMIAADPEQSISNAGKGMKVSPYLVEKDSTWMI